MASRKTTDPQSCWGPPRQKKGRMGAKEGKEEWKRDRDTKIKTHTHTHRAKMTLGRPWEATTMPKLFST